MLRMARWSSNIRTHRLCIEAIESILEDIKIHPGTEHPDLKHLLQHCPIPQAPKKKEEAEFLPALDFDEMGSEA